MNETTATTYLSQFIGKNLRIHTTDARMFIGQMRCTDKDRNIILSLTHEYRAPSASAIRAAIAQSGNPNATVPLSSRFVGLVVVPGEFIERIEYEESVFARERFVP